MKFEKHQTLLPGMHLFPSARLSSPSGKGKTAARCLPLFSSSKDAATAEVISQSGTEQDRFGPLNGGRLRGRPRPRFPLRRIHTHGINKRN